MSHEEFLILMFWPYPEEIFHKNCRYLHSTNIFIVQDEVILRTTQLDSGPLKEWEINYQTI